MDRALAALGLALSTLVACGCTSMETPSALADTSTPAGVRAPVVVELFSSEGCSSCPPADRVLKDLATSQPVAGAEVIALELHVDYWNYLGWSDPFSSSAWSARQRRYADAAGKTGVYTPQMIVDGDKEFTGSRGDTAKSSIQAAAKLPKAKVLLSRQGDKVLVSISELPDPTDAAEVFLAVTEDGLKTNVPRGENAGSVLAHGPVVRSLKKLGDTKGATASFESDITLDSGVKRDNARAVVFIQRKKSLKMAGAAAISMK